MQYLTDFDEMSWVEPIPGLKCKEAVQGDKCLRLVVYDHSMEPHWCELGHQGYILEGELEVEFQNQVLVYRPGQGIQIPAGQTHRHRAKVLSDYVKAIFVNDLK